MAVSGGADSVAMLHLLYRQAEAWGLQLVVAHFDHHWRAESGRDAEFVAALAARLGLPFRIGELATPAAPGNREQIGRQARYRFFQTLLRRGEATRIATGHTADDQAETVLLRVMRGAGATGLAGIMPARDGGTIIRPMLWARREELRRWLQERGEAWREDPSNLDLKHRRNLLRQRFLPELEAAFNPALTERLGTMAAVAQAEEAFWASYVEPLWSRLFEATAAGWRVARQELQALPLAVRRRVLRESIRRARGDLRQVEFAAIEVIIDWMEAPARHPRRHRVGGVECRLGARYLEVRAPTGL